VIVDIAGLLKKVSLFSNLSESDLNHIAEYCVERSFEKGEVIVRQGNNGIGLYMIISGKVKIVKQIATGERLDIAELGPGEFFGEITVLDNAPRTATVVAIESCTCLILSAWEFKAQMVVHPEIALKILPVLVKRFRETNERLLALT
jgi:CRP-like cAMP-binding protein